MSDEANQVDAEIAAKAAAKVETKIATVNADLGLTGAIESKIAAKEDGPAKPEVTGPAIARMMGVATSSELRLLEGKVDLLSTKLNTVTMRMDKLFTQLSNIPTGSDLERVDVQIGALRTMIRDFLNDQNALIEEQRKQAAAAASASSPDATQAKK